ncbi:MAG: hypothetical protein JWM31_550, partial [Solirubrobacterales bacterium]|nr:hypothetical protein [Solirubrobacterales bacterium]
MTAVVLLTLIVGGPSSATAQATPTVPTATATATATGVTAATATLNGSVDHGDLEASYHFEYRADAATLTSSTPETTLAAAAPQAVSATVTGLHPTTLYHVELVATIAGATRRGGIVDFTTAALGPSVITTQATNILTASATVNGTVNTRGVAGSYHFEYGTTDALGSSTGPQSLLASAADQQVSSGLILLAPGTRYYFKLVATTSIGTGEGATLAFATLPLSPVVTTSAPTNVGTTTALLGGAIANQNVAASYHFEYGTTTDLLSRTPEATLGASMSAQPVSTDVTGLKQGTTYFAALVATTIGGTTRGATLSFTTAGPPPVVTTLGMQSIGGIAATVSGRIDTGGLAGTYSFEYGTTTALGTSTAARTISAGTGSRSVTGALGRLTEATTYFVRLVATTTGGTRQGETISFKTIDPPAVTTLAATKVTATTVTLNGSIDTKNHTGTYSFRYGTSPAPSTSDTSTANATLAAGTGVRPVEVNLTGLTADTTYFVQLSAFSNGCGGFCDSVFGTVLSFKTPLAPAVVTTTAGTNVAITSATLNGTIDNLNAATTYHFEYGPTAGLGSSTPDAVLAAGTGAKPVAADVTGLSQATTYSYALVATTANGTSRGEIKTLDTGLEPPAKAKELLVSIDDPSVPEGLAKKTSTGQRESVCKQVYNRDLGQYQNICDFTGDII